MPASDADLVERYDAVASKVYADPQRLRNVYLRRLFEGVPLAQRSLLDVGAGSGIVGFWAAMEGARVVCLEPGGDGHDPVLETRYGEFAAALGDRLPVELDVRPLQEVATGERRFDVMLLHNSVNHLDEDAAERLHRDAAARRVFGELFRLLASLTEPGGDLVVADCSRRNLFGALGVRNPFFPDIEWRLHQQPRLWAHLLEEAGFTDARIRWNAMTRAGRVGELLLSNPVGAFCTTSHFTIKMRR